MSTQQHMDFEKLGLSAALQNVLADAGYSAPTAVQTKAIPLILAGQDMMVAAQTGTGKTASFIVPLLDMLSNRPKRQSNRISSLILVPTRELAKQVHQFIERYGKNSGLKAAVVFGGVKINPQMMNLRGGIHLLVATPGRLLDLHRKNAVKFDRLNYLVLDEADEMLNRGFADEVNELMSLFPEKKQTLLFSATLSSDVRSLAAKFMKNPAEIATSPERVAARKVKQWLIPADKEQKTALVIALTKEHPGKQAMVFVNAKKSADRLATHLTKAGVSTVVIHGDKSQSVRTRNLEEFKGGRSRVLIGTDLASRGLDIDSLPTVINFELPKVPENYVHRIGRTGRAEKAGQAISLVSADEYDHLRKIEQLIQEVIPREQMAGFKPNQKLAESNGVPAPRKPKKPKKTKKKKQQNQPK